MGTIYLNKNGRFLGRNGEFKTIGINAFLFSDDMVVLEPVTSKDRIGRCYIMIPKENVSDMIRLLADSVDDIAIPAIWSVKDFENEAEAREATYFKETGISKELFDRSKFSEALKMMCEKHDCEIGTTWNTVNYYLDEYCLMPD